MSILLSKNFTQIKAILSDLQQKSGRLPSAAYARNDPLVLAVILMTLAPILFQFVHIPAALRTPLAFAASDALSAAFMASAFALMRTALRQALILFAILVAIPYMRIVKADLDPVSAYGTTLATGQGMHHLHSLVFPEMTFAIACMQARLLERKLLLACRDAQDAAHLPLLYKQLTIALHKKIAK